MIRQRWLQYLPDIVQQDGLTLLVGMDAIRLHVTLLENDAIHEEWHKQCFVFEIGRAHV